MDIVQRTVRTKVTLSKLANSICRIKVSRDWCKWKIGYAYRRVDNWKIANAECFHVSIEKIWKNYLLTYDKNPISCERVEQLCDAVGLILSSWPLWRLHLSSLLNLVSFKTPMNRASGHYVSRNRDSLLGSESSARRVKSTSLIAFDITMTILYMEHRLLNIKRIMVLLILNSLSYKLWTLRNAKDTDLNNMKKWFQWSVNSKFWYCRGNLNPV